MIAREAFNDIQWSTKKEYVAQLRTKGGLSVNLEDFYTKLVKDAARTNRFSSDIRYTFNEIEDQLNEFTSESTWSPVLIGFRRNGVDGTSFVLSRIQASETRCIYANYFAFYGVDVTKEEDCDGFYKIHVCECWT